MAKTDKLKELILSQMREIHKLDKSLALKEYFNLNNGNFPVATDGSYHGLFRDIRYFNEIVKKQLHNEVKITFHFKDKESVTVKVTDLPDILKPRALKPFFKWLKDNEEKVKLIIKEKK